MSETSEEKAEVRKGLSLKVLVLGVILCALVSFFGSYNDMAVQGIVAPPFVATEIMSTAVRGPWMIGLVTLVAFVLAIVNSVKRVFSRQEVALLIVMVAIPAFLLISHWSSIIRGYLTLAPGMIPLGGAKAEFVETMLPGIMGSKDLDYWESVLPVWGASIDWAIHIPTIAWFSVWGISMVFTTMFLVLLLRRLYIDVEALQFPIADVSRELVELTQSSSSVAGFFRNKWFLIGFIVQAVWWAAVTFPHNAHLWTGDYTLFMSGDYGTLGGTQLWPTWGNQIMATTALPFVPIVIYLVPWRIGWGAILSIEVLVGTLIGWFALWFVWPLVGSAMGLYPADVWAEGVGEWIAVYRLPWSLNEGGNTISVMMGLIVATALIPLWLHRHDMMIVLKGLWTEPVRDFDPARPVPYRIAWYGFIASFVVMLGAAAAASVMLAPALVIWLVLMVFVIGYVRVIAETGGFLFGTLSERAFAGGAFGFAAAVILNYLFPNVISSETMAPFITYSVLIGGACTVATLVNWTESGGMLSLEAFKLGSITRTNTKDVFKVIAIAFITTTVVSSVAAYVWMHYLPFGSDWKGRLHVAPNRFYRNSVWIDRGRIGYYFQTGILNQPGDIALKFVAALAAAALIVFLRGRFTWFRVSLAGVTLGAVLGWHMWCPFAIALIIKYLVLRTGGTEMYANKLRPLSIGFIAGYCIIFVFSNFIFPWIAGYQQILATVPP